MTAVDTERAATRRRVLRLGTRRSVLARTQSQLVADALASATGWRVELVEVVTHGDRSTEPLTAIGGTGVFVSALRDALLADEVDVAVHSLKDLPTAAAAGLAIAAVPPREDPRDALVARDGLTLGELPTGSTVGTGSPRRAAQLRALGLGLDVVPVRGNVGTRVAMVADGRLDAVVLARAGLLRIGRGDVVTEVLDPLQMLPAPGQGALAVECRAGDTDVLAGCALVDDVVARSCTTAERALLAALEAGCTAPVGALADWCEGDAGPELLLRGVAASPDGSVTLRRSLTGDPRDPTALGRAVAAELLADGAAALVDETSDHETTENDEDHPTETATHGRRQGSDT